MLVYHNFPGMLTAGSFADAVLELEEDRKVVISSRPLDEPAPAFVAATPKTGGDIDLAILTDYVFPFRLNPPIVYVSRSDDGDATSQDSLERLAVESGGTFAGT
jgi:hypothetical protein